MYYVATLLYTSSRCKIIPHTSLLNSQTTSCQIAEADPRIDFDGSDSVNPGNMQVESTL